MRPQKQPLAMPLSEKSFGNRTTLSFFENLLPEGAIKENIQRHHKISGVFEFLARFGRDCAGAITLTPNADEIRAIDGEKLVALELDRIYEALDEKDFVADAIADLNPGYLSLAGAQDKFPAVYREGEFFLPTHGAPTTHIVKAPIQHSGIKESVYNEYYCMELARTVGLAVPKCLVLKDRHPLFVIERYDRFHDQQGLTHRIHQQDFCQAQGFTSELKYEDQGGPTIKQNYELILETIPVKKRLESLRIYLDWIAFNLLIGNNDSHSKNISLLLWNNSQEIAPLYDLLCTAIYPKLKRAFSFTIGGQADFTRLSRKNFELLNQELGLKPGTFEGRLAELKQKIDSTKDELVERIKEEHPDAKIPERISRLINDRVKSLQLQGLAI
jgi:serine/threonine-protein kinase HipA